MAIGRLKKKKNVPPRRLGLEELEPRILFSADLAPGAEQVVAAEHRVIEESPPPVDVGLDADFIIPTETANDRFAPPADFSADDIIYLDSSGIPLPSDNTATAPAAPGAGVEASITTPREIVFVDAGVANFELLAAQMPASAEVIVLDAGRDGLEQITEALASRNGIDAVHIFSHGVDGGFQVGSTWVNQFTLDWQADVIASWRSALTEDADLLLYGCNIAATPDGQAFVERLAALAEAEVAASTNDSGHASLGGDWRLETTTGRIESQALQTASFADWVDVLAVTANGTATSTQATSVNSLTWSHTVNSGSNRALFVTLAIDGVGASVTGVTYGGVALTQVGRTGGNHAVEIWRLINPTVGTANVVVSLGATTDIKGGAVTYNGVHQTAPTGNYESATSTGTTASVVVQSGPGEVVIDITNWDDNPAGYTIGAGQTAVWNLTNTAHRGVSTTEAGAATVTMSSTVSTSQQWEIGAVAIKAASNSAPSGTDKTITINEDSVYTFTVADFGFTDSDGNNILNVWFPTLPAAGTLRWNGTTFAAGNFVSASDISAGLLTYTPAANGNGTPYTSFTFQVQDDGGTAGGGVDKDPTPNTITFNVTAINDAPDISSNGGGTNATVAVVENTTAVTTVTATDADGDTLSYAIIGGADAAKFTINSTSGALSFVTAPSYATPTDANGDNIYEVSVRVSDGNGGTDTQALSVAVVESDSAGLWLSANNTATTSAGSGGITYDDGQVVRFTNPNLALGSGTTAGTFSAVFNLDTWAADGNADLGGLHVVSRTVTVGTTNPVTLQAGDVLFSVKANETFSGVAVTKSDVVLFRPSTPGNYTSGTFSLLLRNPGNTGNTVRDFALVEQAMTVGGAALQAGDFLLVLSTPSYHSDINLFRPTTMATSPTGGTLSIFIDGNGSTGIGISQQIYGLDLVQQNTVIGGQSLQAGELLVSLNGSGTVGTNSLSVTAFDVFKLTVTATGNTTSSASAAMVMRGADVGLSAAGEESDALALLGYNRAPVLTGANALTSLTEDPTSNSGTLVSALIAGRVTDPDTGALSGIAVTAVDNSNGTWQYSTNGGSTWSNFGSPSNTSARLLAANASTYVRFVPNANWNGTVASGLTFRAWDQTSGTAGSTADATVNGGTSAFSSATASASITVTAVNDAPVNALPANTYTALNTSKVFSSAGGNAIQISDVDAASSPVQVTLSVTHGTLTLGSTTGLTLSSGANGSATMTYTGTVSTFNTAFNAGLTFTPTAGFIGLAQLTLVTDDQGNTGTGGALSDTDTLNIHVGAIVVTNATDVSNGTVTSITNLIANDGGDGISLREAIQATNATAGADRIAFAIGSGAQTITLSSALPTITETLTIDGWTQPGFTGTPLVILDGEQAASIGLRLGANADGSTIRGLVLRDFSSHAIQIDAGSSNNTIEGNYIGSFDVAGADQGVGEQNVGNGIYIEGDHNTIGGTSAASRNVIGGNQASGILISGTSASYNTIQNNFIGLNATGASAVANAINGIRLASGAHHNAIGTAGYGNVISGNTQANVFLDDGDDNIIQANFIGTNAAGTGDVNGTGVNTAQSGIVMRNGSTGNLVGGTTAAERNIISGNNWFGVEILDANTRNNTVSGNYIGTDVTGLVALSNSGGGASFWGAGTGNLLGGGTAGAGNVISGNAGNGVFAGSNANTATIQGNIIGLGADGSTVVGNAGNGIYVASGAKYTLIGSNADGTNDSGERNIISGNANGIVISGTGTYSNEVYGNYIGTDATGLVSRGNTNDGVRIEGGAPNNHVGGAAAAHRNIIAGNGGDGIQISGEDSDGNSIQKNWIGLAADGLTALGNGSIGIFIDGGADNTIVGGALLGNVIVGPTLYGIVVEGNSSGTVIEGNYIGTDASQTVNAGVQYHGILIRSGASNNSVGDTAAWQGNVVANYDLANQGYDGVRIYADAGTGNAVTGNAIYQAIAYSGRGLGIDIAGDGVTANDTLDADTGANDVQNAPILTDVSVDGSGTTVTVSGSLNTLASVTGVVLHFYATPSTGNYNSRQGQRYLGSTTVNTDASGNATFTNVALTGYSGAVAAGEVITATATYANSTSEFSQGVVATASAGNGAPSALQATETHGGGLRLNADGGNDAYLISNTGLPSALSAMTVEIRFAASDTPTETVFISYNTPSGDELSLNISSPTNGLELDFGTGSGVVSNAINYRTALLDGAEHTLSVTWSNTAGAWAVYIDGVLADSGSGLFTGGTLSTGGRFVFGQEQDSLGGSFDASQYFSGTLYEVRLFDTVRTATQLGASDHLTLPYDTSGLILNWRFDELSTAGVVTERVRGNDLTLGHAVGAGFTGSTPALTLTVRENAATGTVVGTLAGLDIDREAKITQLLAADADLRYSAETGKFYKLVNSTSTWSAAQATAMATTLSGVAGQLVTIGSASENALVASFAQSMSNSVWIGASDQAAEGVWRWYSSATPGAHFWQGGGTGYNVGDAFTLWQSGEPTNGGGTEHFAYLETDGTWNDVSATASFGKLIIEWNADAVLDATHALSYSITSQTVAGAFSIDSSTGVITVANGSLLDYESNPSHALTVRVTDGGGLSFDKTFTVTVSNVAIEPALSVPSAQTTSEDTALVFSTSNGNPITVTDHNAGTDSRLQVSLSVENGYLTLAQTTGLTFISGANGSPAMVINGTESALNAALDGLTFTPNGNFSGSVNLQITAAPHADMAGWYTFASGSANDQSAGTTYHGTLGGSATTAIDAQRGEVLRLDGDHDYVQISGTFGDPANVTLAAWVRFDSADTHGGEVISLGDHLGLRVDSSSSGVMAFFWDGTSWQQISTNISLADGQWHHLAFSFDDTANAQTLYIDGAAVASAAFTASIVNPGWFPYTRIGDHVSNSEHDYSFNGLIDDVQIYTRALSAAEIATLASDTATQSASVTINVTTLNDAPTFSVGDGRNYLPVAGMEFGNAVAQQADGKYLVTGWSDVNGTRDFILARFNADGSLDTTFGAGTGYVISAFGSSSDEAQNVRVLDNGKILVVGYAYVSGNYDIALAQYNADGSLDTSFGGGTGKALSGIAGEDTGYTLAIQSDGKILVGGGTASDFLVARFHANGTLDTTFGTSGRVTTDFAGSSDLARSLIVQPDGKIILAGQAFGASTWTDFAVARYLSNGTLDTSFNGTGKVTVDLGANVHDNGYAVALQNDGTLLIAGWSQAGGTADLALIRLTTAGALDSTFGTGGKVITPVGSGSDFGHDVKVQADGKVLVSGYASNSSNDFIVVRYNTDGTLDSSFGTSGKVVTNFTGSTDDRGTRMFLQGDGKIVLAGGTTQGGTYDLAIARYNSDGSPDVTFNAANTLGGTRSYTEGGTAVVLDSDVQIFDADLAGAGSYEGATLTLVRDGGANAEDLLMFDGVVVTTSGANVYVSGTQVGTYTLTGGQLTITFGADATQTRVNTLMRNIVYANASDAPPASVQINWSFSDGNTGTQGSGGALTATGSVTVNITAVNDAPVLSNTALTLTVAEDAGAPAGAVGSPLSAFTGGITDADAGAVSGIAIVATDETYGTWYYTTDGGTNWNPVGSVSAAASLLLANDASTRLYFAPAAHYNGSATSALTLRAWDQTSGTAGTKVSTASTGGTTAFSSATDVIDVTVTSINDAPAGTDRTVTTSEDTDYTFAVADFGFTDPNDAPANALLAVRITTLPGVGTLKLSGVAVTAGQSISAADISAGNLKFSPAANANGAAYASFTFQVQDDGGTASGGVDLDASPNTITIDVTAVNDAPVLTPYAPSYSTTEDATAITTTVAALLGSSVTDVDVGAIEGIALYSLTGSGATVQYSLDGTTWTTVGNVYPTSALLLRATDYLRLTPATDNGGTLLVSYRAWDQTVGTAGTQVDVTTNGGNTAFSSATDTATVTIASVNDAPTATITPTSYSATEQTTLTLHGTGLSIADIDAGSATVQAIVSVTEGALTATAGTSGVTLSGSGTSSVTLSGNISQINNLLAGNGSATLTYLNSSDAPAANVTLTLIANDLGNSGSGGALTGSDTATIHITAVNDAPVLTISGTGTATGGSPYTLNLSAIDPDGTVTITSWTINWGDGTIVTYAGNPTSVTHTYAQAGMTYNVLASATDADGTWLQNNLAIPRWSGGGLNDVRIVAPGGGATNFGSASLTNPVDVVQGPGGYLYVTGYSSDNILRFNPDGTGGSVFISSGTGGLDGIAGMAFGPDGNLYVASGLSHNVLRFNGTTGAFIDVFASGGLNNPNGLAFGPDGHLYVNNYYSSDIVRFNGITGQSMGVFATHAAINGAEKMVFGPDGNLYVGNRSGNNVLRFDGTTGAYLGVFASTAGMTSVGGIAFGPDGHLYVSDWGSDSVRRFNGATGALIGTYVSGGLSDPQYLAFIAQHQVTVTNHAPSATNLSAAETYTEDTPLNLTDIVISDVDSPLVSARLTLSDPSAGSLSTGTSGSVTSTYDSVSGVWRATGAVADVNALLAAVTFNPVANFNADFTISVLVTDNQGATTPGVKSVTGIPVNDAPTATITPTSYSATEQTTLTLHGTGLSIADIDAGSATVQAIVSVTEGALTATAGTSGVTVSGSGTSSVTLSGTISQINNLLAGNGGATLTYFNSSDAPAANITLTLIANDLGNSGSGGALTGSDTATIHITAVNDAPVITSDGGGATASLSVAENTTAVTTVTSTDVDGGAPTYSILGGTDAARFTIDANTGALSFVTPPDFESPTDADSDNVYEVTVQVSDGAGGTDMQSIAVTVTNVNEAPAGTDRTVTTDEDTDYTFSTADFGFTDPNDSPANVLAAVKITTLPGAGSLKLSGVAVTAGQTISVADISAGHLKFTPAANANGTAYGSFTFQVQDDGGTAHGGVDLDPTPNTLTINVAPVNDAPVATAIEGSAIAYTENDGPVAITATLTLTDIDDAQLESATVRITGNYVNGEDVLTFTDQNGITGAWNAATGTLTLSGSATIANYQAALRSVAYANGSDNPSTLTRTISFTVNDGEADSNTVTRNIQITAVNDEQSLAVNNGMTVAENSTGNALSAAVLQTADVDNSPAQLDYTLTTAPIHGTLRLGGVALTATDTFTQADINAGLLTYDHDGSETIADSFGFSVDDGAGGPSTGTFNITVTPVNDNAPVITSNGGGATATLSIPENAVAVTTVTASDADLPAQTLTYSIVGGADSALFTINPSTGALSFTVARDRETATDANGDHVYEVVVQVSDGTLTDTQAISVTITDVDEFDVGPVSDSNGAPNVVAENATVGTAVGITASAADADATHNATTYSLDDDAGGRFAIDATTGVVTVAGALDYESAASHTITVRATSADGSFSTQSFTINVTDVNEAGVGAIADTDGATDFVLENSTVGSLVGVTAFATDPDGTDSVAYSLDDDAGGRFAIDAVTGVVTVAGALDREALGATLDITVRATSTDGSFTTRTFTIALGDVDEFDVGAVSDSNGAPNVVAENATVGTAVSITASAADADATNNTITYSLDDDAGGRFAIDATTGVVTVAGALDYESAASHSITVRATSADGSFSTQTFTINVNDVNEAAVGAIADTNGAADFALENSANGTVVGVTAFATDPDGTDSVAYSLDDDAGGLFAIDTSTGVVTVAGALDREALGATLDITVRATSTDGSFTTRTFTIALGDVDEFDVGPVSDANASANTVAENAAIGASVGLTAFAQDLDATNNTITYSLDDDAGGRFAIDGTTGVVTVAGALDYESAASHSITVRATSADGSFSTQSFTINVTDVNEAGVGAIADTNGAADFVLENSSVGTVVGVTAFATDPDGTDSVAYSLDDDAGGLFAIDASTGVVTVAGALDREALGATLDITVRATSTDGSFTTRTFTVAIGDVDEFDVGAVTDANGAANTVAEDATVGTTVGITASASDADATNNAITYSLDDDAGGRFAINSTTGVVTVASALDYESATSHTITVRATSADGSLSTQSFTINVTDVNEAGVGAIADTNGAADFVLENSTVGSLVGVTAFATDPDGTDSVAYSLDDDAGGLFAIDTSTGVVTVAGALDREALGATLDITVRATSTDGSFTTRTFTIALGDVDEFDVGPVSDSNGAPNVVAENATVGTAVSITASAADADATNNTITYSLDDDAGGRFAIDATTGVVTVAGALDYESAASHTITVRATSADGSFSTQSFTINVTDVNEAGVGAIADTNGAADFVLENSTVGSLVGVTAFATDPDGTDSVAYSLDDDAGGLFAIDTSTGVVTVAGALDREALGATLDITVRATSTDGSFTTRTFTIALGDENDNPPVITGGQRFTVAENSPLGTSLGTVTAVDADLAGALQNWQIVGGTGLGVFSIDASTGELRVANPTALDYESTSAFTLDLIVSDGLNTSAIVSVTIDLTPVNEAPVLVNNTGAHVEEGGVRIIDASRLRVSDVDTDATQLVYVLTAAPTEGLLWRGGDPLDVGGTFTQADIDAGRMLYVHYGAESRADSFRFSVSDGSIHLSEGRFDITVTPVNDAPTASDGTVSLDEDSVYAFRTSDFGYHDSDGDALAAVRIETLPTAGELRLHGALVAAGTVVSATDIVNGALTFQGARDAWGDGYARIGFTVFDGSVFSAATTTLTLNVRPVDDLPTLSVPQSRPKGLPGQEIHIADALKGLIGIGDVDGEQDQQQLILNVEKGHLWIPAVEGVTWEQGRNGAQLVLSGSVAALNAALQGLKLTPPADHVGPLSLRFEVRSLLQLDTGPAAFAELALDLEWPAVPPGDDATNDRSQQPNTPTEGLTTMETGTTLDSAQRNDRAGLYPAALGLTDQSSNDNGNGGPTDPVLWLEVTHPAAKSDAAAASEIQTATALLSAHGKLLFHADVLKLNLELFKTPFDVKSVDLPLHAGTVILPIAQDTVTSAQSDVQRQILVKSVEYGAMGVTIGTVLWLLRSGSLLSSLLLSYPAWRNLDPLPILAASGTGADDAVRDRTRERVRSANPGTARKEGRAHADNPEQESLDRITS